MPSCRMAQMCDRFVGVTNWRARMCRCWHAPQKDKKLLWDLVVPWQLLTIGCVNIEEKWRTIDQCLEMEMSRHTHLHSSHDRQKTVLFHGAIQTRILVILSNSFFGTQPLPQILDCTIGGTEKRARKCKSPASPMGQQMDIVWTPPFIRPWFFWCMFCLFSDYGSVINRLSLLAIALIPNLS